MSPQPPPDLAEDKERETNVLIEAAPGSPAKAAEDDGAGRQLSPAAWLRMLARELHWSFVLGVAATYGVSQGLGGGISRVASDYYWKDVQRVQPSVAQVYQGITSIPWMIKPLWGLLTDVLPVAGYRRRPYFILAGEELSAGLCWFLVRVVPDFWNNQCSCSIRNSRTEKYLAEM